jgi:hypothetical protein
MRPLCCLCIPPINFWMVEPIFMKFGMYITHLNAVYFINPSHHSVCLYVYLHIVARQQLGKNVTAAKNTQATT